jgi:hypothetical protein
MDKLSIDNQSVIIDFSKTEFGTVIAILDTSNHKTARLCYNNHNSRNSH